MGLKADEDEDNRDKEEQGKIGNKRTLTARTESVSR